MENNVVLKAENLVKKFGGNIAVNNASFEVYENIVNCLIGPNGSGKTTIFNLITGTLPNDGGSCIYKGEEILGKPTGYIVEKGIARTFQDLKLFTEFTVLQNVLVAIRGRYGEPVFQGLFYSPKSAKAKADYDKAMEVLKFIGLEDKANTVVRSLPYGEQKLVSVARLYAAEADLLLLDEPASGMDKEGYKLLSDVIEKVISMGKTVLLVEHNIDFVREVAQHVVFLHHGEVLKQGSIDEIMADRKLTEIYFGF